MSDTIDKVYQSPVTPDDWESVSDVPQGDSIAGSTQTANSSQPYQGGQEQVIKFPEKIIAVELLSSVMNTQKKRILGTFTLGQLGGIKIGNYVFGESGEVDITSNGLTGTDVNGATTFSIDASTGDATFKGTIQAGTVIAGATEVGGSSVIIDGANGRIVVNDGVTNRIVIGNV